MRSMSMCWPAPCSTLSPKHRSKEIGRRGAPMALPSFSGAGAKLSAVMQTIVRAQAKLQQATLRTEAGQRRHDSREWVMRRKERTRHLIELGGLVQKAGLVDLTDADRAPLSGAILALARPARGEDAGAVLALWKRRRQTTSVAGSEGP